MKKGVEISLMRREIERNRKIILRLIIAIIIILIVIIITFIIIFKSGKTENSPDENPLALAVEKGDISKCEEVTSEKEKTYCKILISVSKKDTSFCSKIESNASFVYSSSIDGIALKLDAQDYCWIKFALRNGESYCNNIINNEAKQSCLQDIK